MPGNDVRLSRPAGLTILPWPPRRHKVSGPPAARAFILPARAVGALAAAALAWSPLAGQQRPEPLLRPVDAAVLGGAALVYAAPHLLELNQHPASCAPCDPATLPWFDRWALAQPRSLVSDASGVAVLSLAAFAAADLGWRDAVRRRDLAYLAESGAWALASAELIKAVVARKRPVLYTPEAPARATDIEAQRSWPSGHTAVAFALATGYLLAPRRQPVPAWRRWMALGLATGVAVLRVTAGQHFPSDVVGGAALGAASAFAVRAVRF